MASLEQLPIGRRYARESVASPLPFLQALYRKKAGNSHSRYPKCGISQEGFATRGLWATEARGELS